MCGLIPTSVFFTFSLNPYNIFEINQEHYPMWVTINMSHLTFIPFSLNNRVTRSLLDTTFKGRQCVLSTKKKYAHMATETHLYSYSWVWHWISCFYMSLDSIWLFSVITLFIFDYFLIYMTNDKWICFAHIFLYLEGFFSFSKLNCVCVN